MKPNAEELEGALREAYGWNLEVEEHLKKLKSILNVKKLFAEDEACKHLELAVLCATKHVEKTLRIATITMLLPLSRWDKAKEEENENE